MTQSSSIEAIPGSVAITDLADEFGLDLHKFRRWLLRHEFCVNRELDQIAILTATEVAMARFLNTHGVLVEKVRK